MRVAVTGGAGYIGSVVAEHLTQVGHSVLVLDNLSQGHRTAVPREAEFFLCDLADYAVVHRKLSAWRPDAVMHFASNTLVGESMEEPLKYLQDNLINGLNLIRAVVVCGVQRFILSSTANLFGAPQRIPIDEDERIVPGSPYGESKYQLERSLHWMHRTRGLRFGTLRYFNAAGATVERGESHNPETHLIPLVLQVALGQREFVNIYGDDYPTLDGTCVRDYIHVSDLARAHTLTLDALDDNGQLIFNVGNEQGSSVREVIEAARRLTGHPIPTRTRPRRPGDPATLVASSTRIREQLGFAPRFGDLEEIIRSAWDWHRRHPRGYEGLP